MRFRVTKYRTWEDLNNERDAVPWYWRLVALASSWMILGGLLILPSTFDSDPKLRFSKGVLTIIIVALLTAGFSFTALLCFACRSWLFQAETVFLPALTSSALGLLTVLYVFSSSTRYNFNAPAIVTLFLSTVSCLVYGALLLWTHRKIARVRHQSHSRSAPHNLLKDSNALYNNYIANMYPTVRTPSEAPPLTEEEMVNQQMAMLLMKTDPGPSPDASGSTFRIDLPGEDRDEPELLGTPRSPHGTYTRGRSGSGNGGERSMWERIRDHGRGRTPEHTPKTEGRPLSREERRVQIELGQLP